MLDSAGAAAALETKPKANKGSTKSAQRFWPENIASLQVQQPVSVAEDSDSHISIEVSENLLLHVVMHYVTLVHNMLIKALSNYCMEAKQNSNEKMSSRN